MFSNHDHADVEPPAEKPRRVDSAPAEKSVHEQNPVWQSLALRPITIQPKLTINQPGDPYEQEADRIAERVVRAPAVTRDQDPLNAKTALSVQARSKGEPEAEAHENPSRGNVPDVSGAGSEGAPPIVQEALSAPGQPLDSHTQKFFESRFQNDFDQVQVHSDGRSAESARAMQAQAYTAGRDIVFGPGQYAPATDKGKRLIAHELAHVLQQRGGLTARVQRQTDFGDMYRGTGGKVRSHGQKEYDVYKDSLGKTGLE